MSCTRRPGMEGGSGARCKSFRGCVATAVVAARHQGSGRPGSGVPVFRYGSGRVRGSIRRQGVSCRGAVTAEFAVAMPAVLLLLALLLAGSAAGLTQLRLEEAARAGARALARGEDVATVEGIVRRFAGESAISAVASDGGWLAVTVSARVAGAVGPLVPWTLSARAWAWRESADAPAVRVPWPAQERRNQGRAA